MKTLIGIFRGKQKKHNKYLLETLYEKGPLTAWALTQEATKTQRISLHATFNKRLRNLEQKGYVRRIKKEWYLQFKGIIAVLTIQNKPKRWSDKWTNIFEEYGEKLSKQKLSIKLGGKEKSIPEISQDLRDFELWIRLKGELDRLMLEGRVNLDIIKNETLFSMLISELSDRKGE